MPGRCPPPPAIGENRSASGLSWKGRKRVHRRETARPEPTRASRRERFGPGLLARDRKLAAFPAAAHAYSPAPCVPYTPSLSGRARRGGFARRRAGLGPPLLARADRGRGRAAAVCPTLLVGPSGGRGGRLSVPIRPRRARFGPVGLPWPLRGRWPASFSGGFAGGLRPPGPPEGPPSSPLLGRRPRAGRGELGSLPPGWWPPLVPASPARRRSRRFAPDK